MAKFCSKCENPLQENDKFCRKCGAPVKTIAPEPQMQSAAPSYDIPSNDFDNPEGTVLLGNMNKLREYVDSLEKIMPADLWPVPTYAEMLYSVN